MLNQPHSPQAEYSDRRPLLCTIKILMIEDDAFQVELIQQMLKRQQDILFNFHHCGSLSEAIHHLRGEPVDIILLDLSLPDAAGLEAFERIHSEFSKIPVITLTGNEDESLALSAVRKGLQDYLVKGKVEINLLVRSMRHAIERHRLLAELEYKTHELEMHKESFRNIVENNTEGFVVIDNENLVCFANSAAEIFLKKPKEDLTGKPSLFPLKSGQSYEFSIVRPSGDPGTAEIRVMATEWKGVQARLAAFRDITERKKAEEQIHNSLKEKEVLLKEIHHRVKNNLQIISSLLRLQTDCVKEKWDGSVFTDSQNRIKAMALVHEILYQSGNLAKINFADYIRKLTGGLIHSYGVQTADIAIDIQAADILLGVDAAIPCGLIINELVSNSIKHAFPEHKGKIWIHFFSDVSPKRFVLVVGDNGKGIAENPEDQNKESLGLRLVRILTEQLGGNITLTVKGGTEFRAVFENTGEPA